jgi:DNA polymerase III subunit delta
VSGVDVAGAEPDTEIKPAYLIAGTDEAKISAALARLRARAEAEGGPGALDSFSPPPGSQVAPDADALIAAIPLMSLTAARRYLLAEGVERWGAGPAKAVGAALPELPPGVTVVLVAREQPPRRRTPKGLAEAVEAAGGDVLRYEAPKARSLPRWLTAEASRRGFELAPDAARMLIDRLGERSMRLATELDRLAVWAEPGAAVTADDLAAMIADTSEEAAWALSDAIIDRDPEAAVEVAERMSAQGESVTGLLYGAARRLREATAALALLESGRPAKEVEGELPMHPYAAKLLVRRLSGRTLDELRAATCALADLEWWTRGGEDYPEEVAVTLAIRRAAGARG